MKKQPLIQVKAILWIILLTIVLFNYQPIRAEPLQTVVVSTALELINVIGPDRIIQIKAEVLELPSNKIKFSNRFVSQEKVSDGYQLLIHDVDNLTISGIGEKPVKILAKPRYAYIFAFFNSNNIEINNLEAGHTPGESGCISGVLYFNKCENIAINDSILFGCGSEGVNLEEVDNFKFKNSIIQKCVFGIMTINNSKNCNFEDAAFQLNEGWYLINIDKCENIDFSKCRIKDNKAEGSDYSSIFNISDCEKITVNDCTVENNTAEWFAYKSSGLQMNNTPLNNNDFHRGDLYQDLNPYGEYYDKVNNILALQRFEKLLGSKSNYNADEECRIMIAALEKLKINDDNYEVEFLLGEWYALESKSSYDESWNKAEQCYNESISLNPEFANAHISLANLYFDLCINETAEPSGNSVSFIYTVKKQQSELMPVISNEYFTAVELANGDVESQILYRIFVIFCFQNEFDQALQFSEMLVSMFPEERSFQECLKVAKKFMATQTTPQKIIIKVS